MYRESVGASVGRRETPRAESRSRATQCVGSKSLGLRSTSDTQHVRYDTYRTGSCTADVASGQGAGCTYITPDIQTSEFEYAARLNYLKRLH